MVNNESVTIRGTIAFPNLEREDSMAGKYTVQLANLSDAAVEKLEELGIKVSFKDGDKYERGNFITCKSKFPIIPKDVDGNSFEGMTERVGYGSVVRAALKPVEWKMGGRSGVSPRLQFMVIDRLVEPEEGTGAPSLDDAL
jgi:hypothetical protein